MVRRLAPLVALTLAACTATGAGKGRGPTLVSLNPCTDAILAEEAGAALFDGPLTSAAAGAAPWVQKPSCATTAVTAPGCSLAPR